LACTHKGPPVATGDWDSYVLLLCAVLDQCCGQGISIPLALMAEWWLYDAVRYGLTPGALGVAVDRGVCPFGEVYVDLDDHAYTVGAILWDAGRWEYTDRGRKCAITRAAKKPPRDPDVMAKEILERAGVEIIE